MEKKLIIGYKKNEFYNKIISLKEELSPCHTSDILLKDKIDIIYTYKSNEIVLLLDSIQNSTITMPYEWLLAIENIYDNDGFEFIRSTFLYTEEEAIKKGFIGNAIIIYNNSKTPYEVVLSIFEKAFLLTSEEANILTKKIHEKGSVLIPIGSVYRGNIIFEKIKKIINEKNEKNLKFILKIFKQKIIKKQEKYNKFIELNIKLSSLRLINKDLLLYFLVYLLIIVGWYLVYYCYKNNFLVYNHELYETTKYLWNVSYLGKASAIILALFETIFYSFISMGVAISNHFDLSINQKDFVYVINLVVMGGAFSFQGVLEERENKRLNSFIINSANRRGNLYIQWSPPEDISKNKVKFKKYLHGFAPNNIDLRLRFSQFCLFHTDKMHNNGIIHRIDFLFENKDHEYNFKYISIVNSIHHDLLLNVLQINNIKFNRDSNIDFLTRLIKKNNILNLSKSSLKSIIWFNSPCEYKENKVVLKTTNKVLSKGAILAIIVLSEYIWSHDSSGFNRPFMLNITIDKDAYEN